MLIGVQIDPLPLGLDALLALIRSGQSGMLTVETIEPAADRGLAA